MLAAAGLHLARWAQKDMVQGTTEWRQWRKVYLTFIFLEWLVIHPLPVTF